MNRIPKHIQLSNSHVWIIGLAKSGIAAAKLLIELGAQVFISELRESSEIEQQVQEFIESGVEVQTGGHDLENRRSPDFVIASPGIPPSSKVMQLIRKRDIPVYSEIEVGFWLFQGSIIAITGTNGKTTVAAYLEHVLQSSGINAVATGNIGYPFCDLVREKPATQYAIVEVSSYQLERIKWFHPHISVFTNISPDHLDWHGNMESYLAAKARIWENQEKPDFAVIPEGDPLVKKTAGKIKPNIISFGLDDWQGDGVHFENEEIVFRNGLDRRKVIHKNELKIQGLHNVENVMMVAAVSRKIGVSINEIRNGLMSFSGVPHRLEIVCDNGRKWINDSKSTNVESLRVALEAMSGKVWLIAGGMDKGAAYEPLRSLLQEKVKSMLLIGEGASRMETELSDVVNTVHCGTLETAVKTAGKMADQGTVVLLSPGCASFDQYKNYEDRGNHFRKLVTGEIS